jgi:predicted metal-binding membrane protein
MADGMAMPGGWTMSMAWMRMPGQTWAEAAAMFLGMWIVMMVAMMLPSLAPMLSHYRDTVRTRDERHLARLTALAGVGYFSAWTLRVVRVPVRPRRGGRGDALGALARFVPVATGAVVVLAGCVQLTAWKARQLARCRNGPPCAPSTRSSAWSHGFRLGSHCILCCSGLMAVLLVAGVMDLAAMVVVAAAISVERLAPQPTLVARTTGSLVVALGALALVRAVVPLCP